MSSLVASDQGGASGWSTLPFGFTLRYQDVLNYNTYTKTQKDTHTHKDTHTADCCSTSSLLNVMYTKILSQFTELHCHIPVHRIVPRSLHHIWFCSSLCSLLEKCSHSWDDCELFTIGEVLTVQHRVVQPLLIFPSRSRPPFFLVISTVTDVIFV